MFARVGPWLVPAALLGTIAVFGALLRDSPRPEPGGKAAHARANRVLDLAMSGKPSDVPFLLESLRDPSSTVRDNASLALLRLTRLAWGRRTAECLAWWNAGGERGLPPPADLEVREPPPARDPEIALTLERLSPAVIVLGGEPVPLLVRWTMVHSGSRFFTVRDAPRETHWAYRYLADGSPTLAEESVLPWAWVCVLVRGVSFGPDARPREIACDMGSTLDGLSLAPRQSFAARVAFPVPGAGDGIGAFQVFEIRLRLEPYFRDDLPGVPCLPGTEAAPVFATVRPPWREDTPHLPPTERVRMLAGARATGLEPAGLAVYRVDARPTHDVGRDGTSVARAWRGRSGGPRTAVRPWVYLSRVGWVLLEDDAGTQAPETGPLVPTLTLDAALPGLPTNEFLWGVEFE